MENIFKKRLSEELKAKSMTRQDLADLIDVTAEMVTQYLTTKKLPSLETFAKICKALDVSADYMLGLKD